MNTNTKMKTKVGVKSSLNLKKNRGSGLIIVVLLFLLGLIVGGGYYLYQSFFSPRSNVITVVSQMDGYSYYLNSNATRLYRKYYKLLEEELKDSKVDEESYVSLISQLFVIDFYTLNNKLTNQDIGGIQFVCASLQDKFKQEASATVYKYVRNNMNQNRKQSLPEVNKATVSSVKSIRYDKENISDDSAFEVIVLLDYVEDLDYPNKVKLCFIHEDNKLVLVEMKDLS